MNDPDWAAKNRRAMYNMLPRVENWTAAYKLLQEEARDITVSYVLNNLLTLEKPVTFGKDGSPTYPKIGEKARLKLDNIGGAAFVPDSKAAAGWTMTHPVDLRTAVLAVRLAIYLQQQSKWGVKTIYWGGMGVGRDENDRHGKGYAIDFHGAFTRFGKFDVWADWGNQPINASRRQEGQAMAGDHPALLPARRRHPRRRLLLRGLSLSYRRSVRQRHEHTELHRRPQPDPVPRHARRRPAAESPEPHPL